MSLGKRAKRLTYLVHRWTGVGACLLMALWFVSGVVMLFVGYPKLTPWERMQALPALEAGGCCVAVEQAMSAATTGARVQELVLTTVNARPVYRIRHADGSFRMVDASSGKPTQAVDAHAATDAAQRFTAGASGDYLGLAQEDRWTHSRGLDAHRPLHMVQMDDAAHTLLYVSSTTGQVVMDAPRAQRLWNYVGAWLHWVYMLRDRSVDPGWSWIVIVLSAVCVITSITGTVTGIWRWRFSGRYKSGSRSPYREFHLRWHHLLGLAFASIVFTWIFSGLMSMNPLGMFDAKGRHPDLAQYRGATVEAEHLQLPVSQALALLDAAHFRASELEWRVLGGAPYLLARDARNATRLIVQRDGQYLVLDRWPEEDILKAAKYLLDAPVVSEERLDHYDRYYYARQPEAMMGASERRLPVMRLRFGDPHDTWIYLDAWTGDVALSMDRSQRTGRWLFSFLHSWDLPSMLHAAAWRESVLIILSLGGFLVSVTGIVIGYRRILTWLEHARAGGRASVTDK
ncbi:hypothetical protein J2789_007088 [Variovorax paradoxus]|uniref:PepSY domain-containing protein n=1 Tax=Variovorax atrisoli TaxID=3394203 RepID=UPI00119C7B3A|nr:PepSY domain-containing protein [Variovorax paradoxus]MDR6524377.1 hypothetical protein [Variovorax paradoxus]